MPMLLVVFALTLTACSSQESIIAPVQSHLQAAKTGEAAVSEGSAETDRAALVALYLATTGSSSLGWDNWLCEAPLDQWAGVTTDENGRVTGLELTGLVRLYYIRGAIPPELGNLDKLQRLDLSDNELSGSIPPELGNLGSLQDLSLDRNQLSGSIPPEFGNLNNLRSLELYDNELSGPIPPELAQLDSLRDLLLGGNQLSGCIPSAWLNVVNNDLYRSELPPVCSDDDESTPVEPEPEPMAEITPEIIGLYGTLVSSFTNIFFAVITGGESVEGEGGGVVEINGNEWMIKDFSPDGALIINGTLNVNVTETPIPLTGAVTLSGSQEAELVIDMELSVDTDGLSATGMVTINGAEFDVAELSDAAAESDG